MFFVVCKTENAEMPFENASDCGTAQRASGDLDVPIWGVKAIAAASNLTLRQAYHALEKGYLPASKAGRKWFSTPRRLQTLFAGEEDARTKRMEATAS